LKTTISKAGDFAREVEVSRIEALDHTFHMEFTSMLLSAKVPSSIQKNFGVILKQDELIILRDVIDRALADA
jgi:hypothetical protein